VGRDIETEFKCTYRDMEQGWALSEKDRTGMTEPLTTGQQIVAWWETSTSASEPADLADRIDGEIERLRAALREIADIPHTPLNGQLCQNLAKEALGE